LCLYREGACHCAALVIYKVRLELVPSTAQSELRTVSIVKELVIMEAAPQLPDPPSVYQPLDPDAQQIRLIHLYRYHGIIYCDLRVFSLEDIPQYGCLSYTWGSSRSLQTINVNNGHLEVRENLYNFLVEYSLHPSKYIWIDQISIDQSNIHERGHQVGLMSRIFKQADYVTIWLGDSDEYDQAALDLRGTTKVLGSNKLESASMLMRDVYFTRLWVVQEILLAAAVQILFKDGIYLPWTTLAAWQGSLVNVPAAAHRLLIAQRGRVLDQGLGRHITLFSVNECHNPLDKVYGLLGLSQTIGKFSITPDYTKSVFEIYKDVILALCSEFACSTTTGSIDEVMETNETLSRNLGICGVKIPTLKRLVSNLKVIHKIREIQSLRLGFDAAEAQGQTSNSTVPANISAKTGWWLDFNDQRIYLDDIPLHWLYNLTNTTVLMPEHPGLEW
jgi:hypothetical protein